MGLYTHPKACDWGWSDNHKSDEIDLHSSGSSASGDHASDGGSGGYQNGGGDGGGQDTASFITDRVIMRKFLQIRQIQQFRTSK